MAPLLRQKCKCRVRFLWDALPPKSPTIHQIVGDLVGFYHPATGVVWRLSRRGSRGRAAAPGDIDAADGDADE